MYGSAMLDWWYVNSNANSYGDANMDIEAVVYVNACATLRSATLMLLYAICLANAM